jgi:hypothetical protein
MSINIYWVITALQTIAIIGLIVWSVYQYRLDTELWQVNLELTSKHYQQVRINAQSIESLNMIMKDVLKRESKYEN